MLAALTLLFIGNEVVAQEDVPRFEIGGQFSLLNRNNPSSDFFAPPPRIRPGFGARFTYNVTNNVALEAEGNFFPARHDNTGFPSGDIYQGQFGVKAGKRFNQLNLFIKGRPGFIGFTRVSHLLGFTRITIIHPNLGPLQFDNPEFRIGKATYPSLDVGGVVEFYPSRRVVTRLDIGDTIIRYGTYREALSGPCATICFPPEVFERPAETRHNLQFSAGIDIRF